MATPQRQTAKSRQASKRSSAEAAERANPVSHAGDGEHLHLGATAARFARGSVLRGAVELPGALESRKLQHHDAIVLPAAFEQRCLATSHEIAATVALDCLLSELLVLLVAGRIGDLHIGENVGCHRIVPMV